MIDHTSINRNKTLFFHGISNTLIGMFYKGREKERECGETRVESLSIFHAVVFCAV